MTGLRDDGRKPTLLVLSSTYPRWAHDHEPGFVHELAKRLTDRFRVIALVPHAPGARKRECLDGVDVVRFRYAPQFAERLAYEGGIASNIRRSAWKALLVPGFVLSQLWAAVLLASRERVDLVHAHWAIPQGMTARLLQILTRVPYVLTCHGGDLHGLPGPFWALLRRFATNGADRVTTVSEAMRQLLPEDAARATSVIPMGVDMEYAFVPAALQVDVPTRLLFVGRLVPGKGVDVLLKAFSIVRARHPQTTLILVGDGPEAAALKASSRELGIDPAIRFEGAIEHGRLPEFYRKASLLVAPYSGEEGLGLVLVEALACGCPVVTTRIEAVKDIFGGRWPDHAAEPGSVDSLAHSILSMIASLEVFRTQAKGMRPGLEAKFGWSASASAHKDLMASVIDRQ
jgi:glycosyltransferase involved in cell wall biosynthesis